MAKPESYFKSEQSNNIKTSSNVLSAVAGVVWSVNPRVRLPRGQRKNAAFDGTMNSKYLKAWLCLQDVFQEFHLRSNNFFYLHLHWEIGKFL